jgi:hypothetical protein
MSMTRQERERAVLDLYYNQRKSVREIAKEARISFRDIGAILNKAGEDKKAEQGQHQNGTEKNQVQLSLSTQAHDWIPKYWNWDFSLNTDQFTPKPDGCLINKSDSMVMLINTVVEGSPHQVCKISSNQGIMIPLWIAWCSTSNKGHEHDSDEQLTKCAREVFNLGNIRSEVKVDGVPLAKLDVRMSLIPGSGKLDYKINSPLTNITEFYSKGFNATIPPDTHQAYQVPGT